MDIRININCDNEAFDDAGAELRRILQAIGKRAGECRTRCMLAAGLQNFAVMDANGNTVGSITPYLD